MKRCAFILLLVSTFLLGLVPGLHPCHEAAAGEVSGHSSCHKPAGGTPSVRAQSCCDIACQHACHMVAVLSFEPVISIVAPLAQQPVEKTDRNIPSVVSGIDHIPLA